MTDPMLLTPVLLTPGPLTTHADVRAAMDRDWGSRDPAFIALTAELRSRLLAVANADPERFTCVPIQGAGTYVVEAALGTLLSPDDRLLVLVNGAYGERMLRICARLGRQAAALRWGETEPVEPEAVRAALARDPGVTAVAVVHCETTTGLLNPLEAVAAICAEAGRPLIVDAMSSFAAVPLDLAALPVAAVLASSNKGLEGPPGIAFALVARERLAACAANAPSLALDLHDQHAGFERDGQWRFTPPVQVVAATVEALRRLEAEGGVPARHVRYAANLQVLTEGMAALGYPLLLDPALQAPVIATFRPPEGRPFDFRRFYDALAARGFLIYPGKLTREDSFRIGCIGDVDPGVMRRLLAAAADVVAEGCG